MPLEGKMLPCRGAGALSDAPALWWLPASEPLRTGFALLFIVALI